MDESQRDVIEARHALLGAWDQLVQSYARSDVDGQPAPTAFEERARRRAFGLQSTLEMALTMYASGVLAMIADDGVEVDVEGIRAAIAAAVDTVVTPKAMRALRETNRTLRDNIVAGSGGTSVCRAAKATMPLEKEIQDVGDHVERCGADAKLATPLGPRCQDHAARLVHQFMTEESSLKSALVARRVKCSTRAEIERAVTRPLPSK